MKRPYCCYKVPEIASAFLYNLRGADALEGGQISKGDVQQGAQGYCVAQSDVVGWTAKTVQFRPTRMCEWRDFKLPCMVHPQTPSGQSPYNELRHYNYVVALVLDERVASMARMLNLPCMVTPRGKYVMNVEISRFGGQGPERLATLLA